MTDKQEQNGSSESSEVRIKAAFSRLGVTLDDGNGGDADLVVAALNGAADRMEVLVSARDSLANDIAEITALLEAAGYAVVDGTTVVDRVEAALSALLAAPGEHLKLDDEVASLKRQLAAQKGQVTKAKTAQAVAEAALPGSPRKVGRHTSQFTGRDLLSAIQDADEVVLAFSDGAVEIVDLKPRTIEPDAFELLGSDGVRLRVPELRVHGPRPGDAPFRLAGYGLLLDGEQVAWADRGGVLLIGPGTQHELKDDVVF